MDYAREIERLTLLLDAERSTRRRLQELLNKAEHDRDRYRNRMIVLQDIIDDNKTV